MLGWVKRRDCDLMIPFLSCAHASRCVDRPVHLLFLESTFLPFKSIIKITYVDTRLHVCFCLCHSLSSRSTIPCIYVFPSAFFLLRRPASPPQEFCIHISACLNNLSTLKKEKKKCLWNKHLYTLVSFMLMLPPNGILGLAGSRALLFHSLAVWILKVEPLSQEIEFSLALLFICQVYCLVEWLYELFIYVVLERTIVDTWKSSVILSFSIHVLAVVTKM